MRCIVPKDADLEARTRAAPTPTDMHAVRPADTITVWRHACFRGEVTIVSSTSSVIVTKTSMLILLLAIPMPASAQQQTQDALLSIPDGQMLRCTRGDQTRSVPHVREFRIGMPDSTSIPMLQRSRTITLAADTLGRPLALIESTHRGWSGSSLIIRTVSPDTGLSVRQDVAIDSTAMANAFALGDVATGQSAMHVVPRRPLSAEEREKADSLFAWLWARRCSRD